MDPWICLVRLKLNIETKLTLVVAIAIITFVTYQSDKVCFHINKIKKNVFPYFVFPTFNIFTIRVLRPHFVHI